MVNWRFWEKKKDNDSSDSKKSKKKEEGKKPGFLQKLKFWEKNDEGSEESLEDLVKKYEKEYEDAWLKLTNKKLELKKSNNPDLKKEIEKLEEETKRIRANLENAVRDKTIEDSENEEEEEES